MQLEVRDLSVARGGRLVVAGLGFTLGAGEAMVLRGPNGAGKSTLLRALAGLLPLHAGQVLLDGSPDRDLMAETIAYAGHLDAIKAQLSVAENLAFHARLFEPGGRMAVAARVEAALDRFGLGPLADRPAGACSAGQKRRLSLARLAVADRPLWLLDEPTVSLDAASVGTFAALVQDHCAAGGAVLVATHIDLGLTAPRLLELAPVEAGHAAAAEIDPFLAGDWA